MITKYTIGMPLLPYTAQLVIIGSKTGIFKKKKNPSKLS